MEKEKTKLSLHESLAVASMLFGMFFGAGNLIFPIHMGQEAGRNMLPALLGFILTGVGLPLFGVIALAKSKVSSLQELAGRVSPFYSYFLPCVLYLAIGPAFAISRCATVSFTIAFASMGVPLWIFSLVFFLLVLYFSLTPGRILDWIGKFLNPLFLLFFGILILLSFLKPMASGLDFPSLSGYEKGAFFRGLLEGYNTMDAIAGLIFGVVVVDTVHFLGIKDSGDTAKAAMKSGILSCILMAVIYACATYMGTTSLGQFAVSENGGIALSEVCRHYFGSLGGLFLGAIVLFACLKTAIGLVTTIASGFDQMFTKGRNYRGWAIALVVFSFAVSNVGLTSLIQISLPVLLFLYPLSIVMIVLGLTDELFQGRREVYRSVTTFTLVSALFDMLHAFGVTTFDAFATIVLPFYSLGFGWVVPSILGLLVGLLLSHFKHPQHT